MATDLKNNVSLNTLLNTNIKDDDKEIKLLDTNVKSNREVIESLDIDLEDQSDPMCFRNQVYNEYISSIHDDITNALVKKESVDNKSSDNKTKIKINPIEPEQINDNNEQSFKELVLNIIQKLESGKSLEDSMNPDFLKEG